jgi:hypothetical protein
LKSSAAETNNLLQIREILKQFGTDERTVDENQVLE